MIIKYSLKRQKGLDYLKDAIEYILQKENYNVYDLVEIVKILRSDNGCPWDMEQNHKSIKKDFLEEVYEVIEAIDYNNPEMLREELGDVLLQVVFHTQIETENNSFNLDDVANDICEKLIIRHPHVFGDVKAENVGTVLKNWDSIKKETKGQETYTDTLKSVPKVFPSLMRAQKLGKRSARAGMDFKDTKSAFESLKSEVSEVDNALLKTNKDNIAEELGDLLFACANVARKLDLDAEEILSNANEKFLKRFEMVEKFAISDGFDMSKLSEDELDVYWQKAKKEDNGS